MSTKFLRENMAAQCAGCNGPMGGGQQFRMGKHLDEKHGAGTATRMDELSGQILKMDREAYKKVLLDAISLLLDESQKKNIWDWKGGLEKWKITIVNLVLEHGIGFTMDTELSIGNNYKLP